MNHHEKREDIKHRVLVARSALLDNMDGGGTMLDGQKLVGVIRTLEAELARMMQEKEA